MSRTRATMLFLLIMACIVHQGGGMHPIFSQWRSEATPIARRHMFVLHASAQLDEERVRGGGGEGEESSVGADMSGSQSSHLRRTSARLAEASSQRQAKMERDDAFSSEGLLDQKSSHGSKLSWRESQNLGVQMKAQQGDSLFSPRSRGSIPRSRPISSPSHRLHSLKNALSPKSLSLPPDDMFLSASSLRVPLDMRTYMPSLSQAASDAGESNLPSASSAFGSDGRDSEQDSNGHLRPFSQRESLEKALTSEKAKTLSRKKELMDLLEELEDSKHDRLSDIADKLGDDDDDLGLKGWKGDAVQDMLKERRGVDPEAHMVGKDNDSDDILWKDQAVDAINDDENDGVLDDFDQEEAIKRVKEHFRRERLIDEASSKLEVENESSFNENLVQGSSMWSATKGAGLRDDSYLESELDWESLPESELRRHVKKILGKDSQPKIQGSRNLHPRWYELMCCAGYLTQDQAALNVELRTAIKQGDIEEVEKLINEGADVSKAMPDHYLPDNDIDSNMLCMVWPPLHWAAALDQPDIIKLLVRMGADPNGLDSMTTEGRYLYDECVEGGEDATDEVSRQQWNLCYNMTALHWASHHGNVESVEILCALGADVTLEDIRNRTAIEIAAYKRLNEKQRPVYDQCLVHLQDRLKEQVGSDWQKWWPQLCNDTYLATFEPPSDDPEKFDGEDERWRKYFCLGEFARDANLQPIDVDEVIRSLEANDDPTVRKNEFYHRKVRNPQDQWVPCYEPGKPFWLW